MFVQILGALAALPIMTAPAAPLPAQSGPTQTPTHIEAVTVFRNQALVVRRAEARIEQARRVQKIVLAGFPNGIDESSLQARCSGPARPTLVGFTLQSVNETVTRDPAREAKTTAEIESLEKTIRGLGDEDQALADMIALADERSSGLRTLRQVYVNRIQKEGDVDLSQ